MLDNDGTMIKSNDSINVIQQQQQQQQQQQGNSGDKSENDLMTLNDHISNVEFIEKLQAEFIVLQKKYMPWERHHPFICCALSGLLGAQSMLMAKGYSLKKHFLLVFVCMCVCMCVYVV